MIRSMIEHPIYVGPTTIDCDEKCVVPPGERLGEVPPSRHKWNDVLVCPYCGRQFLRYPPSTETT